MSKPWVRAKTYKLMKTIHKWAGLAACLWLFVLGFSGVILDHHEWRWVNQKSVPLSWTSDRIKTVVLPGTPMRYVATSTENPDHWIGASERGLWNSTDSGTTWAAIPFEGLVNEVPQVHGFVGTATGDFETLIVATDDGLWSLNSKDGPALPIGMQGEDITSVSKGLDATSLLVVVDKSYIYDFDLNSREIAPLKAEANVSGLGNSEEFYRVMMDIHFGMGLLPGKWSIILNDAAGIAMMILALTGVLFWGLPKIWKKRKTHAKTRRAWLKWLYRFHGPTFGLVCLIPIAIVSISAIPMNHIFGFIDWARGMEVERSSLPPVYQAKSLEKEIRGITSWPGDDNTISIATRFGLLHSEDGGESWSVDNTLPKGLGHSTPNLFRSGDHVFVGISGNNHVIDGNNMDVGWTKIEGVSRAITSATIADSSLFVKNSKAIFKGDLNDRSAPLAEAGVPFHHVVSGTPFFLFMADIHSGALFFQGFGYVNDIFVVLAVLLALSGPIAWAWQRWM